MKVRIRKRRARQQRIEFATHGGKRRGAGRKRRGRKRVSHSTRPRLDGRTPVHVTLRLADDVPNLRNYERCAVLRRAFCEGGRKAGFRIVEFTVQGNHLHLISEAQDNRALSRGMQGFETRVTRGLNRLCAGRRGSVWADRYHVELLRTPRQVRAALCYVLNNARRHGIAPKAAPDWIDPFSSARYFDGWSQAPPNSTPRDRATPVAPAETWLLSVGWRRHGLIGTGEVPAARRFP